MHGSCGIDRIAVRCARPHLLGAGTGERVRASMSDIKSAADNEQRILSALDIRGEATR